MASTYQTVRYGSTGSAVRQLQSALNQKGYQLSEDGIFGAKTRAAVRDYQKKNGLLLDGIAGSQTWNHLMSAAAAPSGPTESRQVLSGVSDETAARLAQLEKGYEASGDVTAAQEEQRSIEALRPGAWRSSYAGQLERLYSEISGRGAFRYDPAEDAAFAQYAGMYQRQGRRAMEDTLGQAAALTGGYGSSYAQATGQQSYGEYLQKLNEVLPELEQAARSRYDAEGKSMLQQYQLLQGREDDERSAWEAAMEAWQKEADSAATVKIGVPNDTTNEARALLLLQENGIIKLKDGVGITATKNDIAENPYNVEIVEAEAAQLPNMLKDFDYAVINSNYAINAGLNPVKDSLAIEGAASAYVNVLVVKEGNENAPKILALKAALESKQVVDYINEKYNGSVVSVVENPTDGYDASIDYSALNGETVSIAATPAPHAEILEIVKNILAEKGITLKIQVVNDYVTPNTFVEDGSIDANYFQHLPYLEDFNAQQGTHLVSVAGIHVEPMGLYGGKQTTLDAVSGK